MNIIIIENSEDIYLKELIDKKFKNTEVYLKKNIGYIRVINFYKKI